jgi:hypothetical protein
MEAVNENISAFYKIPIFKISQLFMRRLILSLALLLILLTAGAQFTEDFTATPGWIGNTTDFTVNTSSQLQSNNTTASSNF